MIRNFYICIFLPGILFLLVGAGLKSQKQKTRIYLPLGDSYTICTGATRAESWPVLLCQHLNQHHYLFDLPENPARNGFTTQNLIDAELPLCRKIKPDFVTLLIGVNDWVRGVSEEYFEKQFCYIADEIQKNLAPEGKVLVITIPDFGVTPQGKQYANGRDISRGIAGFNNIIKKEAKKRSLLVADIFTLSKQMAFDEKLIANDALHPSAREYAEWEKIILPEALKLWQ